MSSRAEVDVRKYEASRGSLRESVSRSDPDDGFIDFDLVVMVDAAGDRQHSVARRFKVLLR